MAIKPPAQTRGQEEYTMSKGSVASSIPAAENPDDQHVPGSALGTKGEGYL
jgi:hypothetical protein